MADETTDTRSEEAMIERDIERTQDEMGETIQKLEDSLNPREVARSVMSDDNADILRDAMDLVRQNPVPAALIAIGAIWLLATSSRSPAVRRLTDQFRSGSRSQDRDANGLRPRSAEPAPIGPPPETGPQFDRMP